MDGGGHAPPPSRVLGRLCRWHRSALTRRTLGPRELVQLPSAPADRALTLRLDRASRVHVQNVRDLPVLWPYRQRRHLVVACMDDARALEALRPQIEGLGAALVVE